MNFEIIFKRISHDWNSSIQLSYALQELQKLYSSADPEDLATMTLRFRDILEDDIVEELQEAIKDMPGWKDCKNMLKDRAAFPAPMRYMRVQSADSAALHLMLNGHVHTTEQYFDLREQLLPGLAALPAKDKAALCGELRHMLAELICMELYNLKPWSGVFHLRLRLWQDLSDCINNGGARYGLYFLCRDGKALRVFSPWNLKPDSPAEHLYLAAEIIRALAGRYEYWLEMANLLYDVLSKRAERILETTSRSREDMACMDLLFLLERTLTHERVFYSKSACYQMHKLYVCTSVRSLFLDTYR